jgi:ABC-type transport system involved in multi-copper enzyme maturation permease subunit
MKPPAIHLPIIKLLVLKDWKLFERQLAATVAAGIFALCLLGMARPWSFYIGSLLLIVVLVACACFTISNSLLTERKEHTLPFVMSLPVSPLDFHLAKLIGNLVIFGIPFLIIALGTIAVIVFTPLPNGLVVLALPVFGHILLAFSVSLSVAMAVESEGWNIFVMIGTMLLVNPLLMLLGQIPAIGDAARTETILWSLPLALMLAGQLVGSAAVILASAWFHCRKQSFF